MFTGIVTDVGEVLAVEPRGRGPAPADDRLRLSTARRSRSARRSRCSGVCLTVGRDRQAAATATAFSVDAAAETLRLTTVGRWQQGTRINLERSLKIGDELGGHIVSGHVDGLAELVAREDLTDMARLTLARAAGRSRASSRRRARSRSTASRSPSTRSTDDTFSVLIIPHTLAVTTFGALQGRRQRQPRSRPDGALRGAADGNADGACYRASPLATDAPDSGDRSWHGRAGKAQRKETGVKGARILVVEARFYDDIADALLRGAKRVLDDAQARASTSSRCRARWKFPPPSRSRSMPRRRASSPTTAWSRSAA